MKVAIALNTSWNILNFRSGIVKELIKNDHEVYTISPEDSSTKELGALGCKSYHISLENSGMNALKDFGYYKAFLKALDVIQPDVVLCYTIKPNIYGSIACRKRNTPVINNISGLGTAFLWNKALKTLVKKLYKYAFKSSSHIFFQNLDDKKLFLDEISIKEDITSVLPGSGVDTSYFAPATKKKDNATFSFLMISRLLIDKGIAEYCNAAKILKSEGLDVKFLVLGKAEDGHKRGYSKDKIESLAKEGIIEYLGTTSDVRAYIAAADCVVLPSYREGTARTLLEAASMAKPIVATDVPGCNNIVIDRENGLLCEPRSTTSLVSAMREMALADQSKLSFFAENSRKKAVKEFDESLVINRYLDKIEEITAIKVKKSKPRAEVFN